MLYQRVSVPSTDGFSLPLDVYCPEVYPEIDPDIQRPAVVICPGGAYRYLSPREAEPVALVFAAMGFNAFVAGYRVAPHCYPRPQQDAAAAVAWVRAHAGETHTHPDKIAIMGFSAGGHCAASLGVWWPRADLWAELGLTPEQVKPNALVLSYPVITGGEKAHRGSFENLTGSHDLDVHLRYSLETQVTAQTPCLPLAHLDGRRRARGKQPSFRAGAQAPRGAGGDAPVPLWRAWRLPVQSPNLRYPQPAPEPA